MKKIIIAFLFASLLGFSMSFISAQKPFSYGVKAGVSISGSSTDDFDMAVGLNTGIVIDYNMTRRVFIRSGLDFSMKGAKLERFEDIPSSDMINIRNTNKFNYRLNYFELPAMIGYRHPIAPQTYVFATGGGYFAYGVFARNSIKNYTTSIEEGIPTTVENNRKVKGFDDLHFKPFDFGIIGSIGVEYEHYWLNIGYQYGLLNIHKEEAPNYDPTTRSSYFRPDYSWHNLMATCTIGYYF